MVIKEFIPVRDARISVEKPVKQKPSINERTTIESPGMPLPALDIEENESQIKKPKLKGRKAKKQGIIYPETKEYEKSDILIITEKPQAAEKIALSLGSPRKYTENGASYFKIEKNDKKIIVASAVGHLFNLAQKAGQKGWPVFETIWKPSYEKKTSAFTKRYYDLLKKLSETTEEVIIATDYDIEGEVIGWNVLRFICGRETAKRMKFSTLTSKELENSFENALEKPDWGNAYAGEARHIVDWLYGINLSRALMSSLKSANVFKVLSIGRVQGPALKIIVDREKEIANFKSKPYWNIFSIINGAEYKHPEDIFDKSELEKFKGIKKAIAETKKKEEKILPLHPFDLTTLQREAYRLHKMTPSKTLQIAQKLYLGGIISYPRTSSQKIPDSIAPKEILKKLQKHFPEVKLASRSKPIEGPKSDPAHPSIYPTGEYAELEEDDLELYNTILRRFVSAFCPDAITENTRVTITTDKGIKFTAAGLKILDRGWTKVYPVELKEEKVQELSGEVKIDEIKIIEKETQPPKRYTPTSLVTTLEKKNLGTKATRSMIVDTLFERGYLDGKSIKATPLGIKLIESLEKYSSIIIDENLTRQLEEEMEKIQESKSGFKEKEDSLIEKAKKIIKDISKEFKSKEAQIGQELAKGIIDLRKEQAESNELTECPKCHKGRLRIMYSKKIRRYFVACSAYPECRNTYSLPPNALIKKSDKICESCSYPKLLAIKKAKRPWEFCFNRECEINKKRLEEWKARQAGKHEEKAEDRTTKI